MKDFVLYTDLVGRIWLGEVEDCSEHFVGVTDYDLVPRSKCYVVPEELRNKELIGYSLYELSRNRNKFYNLVNY